MLDRFGGGAVIKPPKPADDQPEADQSTVAQAVTAQAAVDAEVAANAQVTTGAQAAADAEVADANTGAEDLLETTSVCTYDGDRSSQDHVSGMPQMRDLVLGDDDPRDAALAERVQTEDVAWRGRIFDVDRLQVKMPDGRMAVRDVVRHPGAVAIVALTADGKICLVRQYRTALGRVTVEIPAGKLAPGEDPLDCASRELMEETGLRAEQIAFLTTIATSCGFADELIHIYLATGLTQGTSSPDADEFINVDLVPLTELVDAVLDGRIEDAKTVVGALICDAVAHRLEA